MVLPIILLWLSTLPSQTFTYTGVNMQSSESYPMMISTMDKISSYLGILGWDWMKMLHQHSCYAERIHFRTSHSVPACLCPAALPSDDQARQGIDLWWKWITLYHNFVSVLYYYRVRHISDGVNPGKYNYTYSPCRPVVCNSTTGDTAAVSELILFAMHKRMWTAKKV